jgi:hypothetical protein
MNDVSDAELKKVIAEFLEMGLVDNITAMFRREPRYFEWTGELLRDKRFNVRLGLTIVFEELRAAGSELTASAIPSLQSVLAGASPLIRGEAVGILGIIGTREAKELILKMREDDNPQVREMVELALADL